MRIYKRNLEKKVNCEKNAPFLKVLPSWLGLKNWSNCIRHFDSVKKLVDFDHFYEGKSNKISFRSVKIPYSPFIQFHKPHVIYILPVRSI